MDLRRSPRKKPLPLRSNLVHNFAHHTSVTLLIFLLLSLFLPAVFMNLFVLLLVYNAYWFHYITSIKVFNELNLSLTIMAWRFNVHGFKYIILDSICICIGFMIMRLLTGGGVKYNVLSLPSVWTKKKETLPSVNISVGMRLILVITICKQSNRHPVARANLGG